MENENFDEYMEYYKKLPLTQKKEIALSQLKVLATLTNKMCQELNVENEIIINKELLDVNKENPTEDDYFEAIIVYINSIQNSLCDFDLKLTKIMESQEINLD